MHADASTIYLLTHNLIRAMEANGQRVPADLELLRNEAEYEARAGLPDPAQMRAALDFRGHHAEAI